MEFSSYSRTGQIFVLWSNSPKRAFADIEVTDVTNHVLKHLLSVTADIFHSLKITNSSQSVWF